MRSGIKILEDTPGGGALVERRGLYQIRLRMWLNRGEAVRWKSAWGATSRANLEDEGQTLITDIRMDRVFLINGLFYGIEGMCVGGTRKFRISPHLGYGDQGIPDVIPANSVLVAEVTVVNGVKEV